MGILLLGVAGALLFISYYLIRAGLAIPDRHLWPPWKMPTELKLAGTFSSLSTLIAILGFLVLGGTRAFPGWAVVLLVWIGFQVGLLWLDFAHPPTTIVLEDEHD